MKAKTKANVSLKTKSKALKDLIKANHYRTVLLT